MIRRYLSVLTLSASCCATVFAGAEVIGPYRVIEAPIQAELLGGGGAAFNWLNVVNAPVSIQEAFTGLSVIDDGYSNANAGTTIRLTYAPDALRNNPGPDIVLFEAGGGTSDAYIVWVQYEGVARPAVIFASVDTGVDRTYFYGGSGPFTVDVMAAAMDLTAFDVPAGATVTQIRVFTEGPSCDLLGVGVLAPAGPKGDLNCDGTVDFFDIDPFLLALFDADGYTAAYPNCNPLNADVNSDNSVDFFDIDPFVACLFGPCP